MVKQKNLQKRAFIRMIIFGCVTILFTVLSFVGLMQNSQGAVDRFETLKAVDKAGGDVEGALNDLRTYIYSHMNTQIGSELGINPPIQLSGTYDRLVAAEQARVSRINESLDSKAIAYCEAQNPDGFSGRYRIECVESYKVKNGAEQKVIEDDFYKFDFVPPRWSPDLAGFSILLAIFSGLIFFIDLILYFRTRHMVHMAN